MRHICFTEAEVKTLMRILEREFSATKKLSQFNELRALLDKIDNSEVFSRGNDCCRENQIKVCAD